MSELRFDVFTGSWVAVVPSRAGIGTTRPAGLPAPGGRCPFCPGNEADLEPTVLEIGSPWKVRVVTNKYPVATPALAGSVSGGSLTRPARGGHEVIIETPRHDSDLASYDVEQVSAVLIAVRERLRWWESREGIASVSVFRNRGRRAGSSQPHPHSQLLALEILPREVALRWERIKGSASALLEEALELELRDARRVLSNEGGVVSWCPFAPSRAWESRIALIERCPRFSATTDAQLERLARHLIDVCARTAKVLGDPDYNVVLRDPPVGAGSFFTLDVLPRTGGDAGFEIQSGVPIVVVRPEDAAHALRSVRMT